MSIPRHLFVLPVLAFGACIVRADAPGVDGRELGRLEASFTVEVTDAVEIECDEACVAPAADRAVVASGMLETEPDVEAEIIRDLVGEGVVEGGGGSTPLPEPLPLDAVGGIVVAQGVINGAVFPPPRRVGAGATETDDSPAATDEGAGGGSGTHSPKKDALTENTASPAGAAVQEARE